jgi:hypothetical protein
MTQIKLERMSLLAGQSSGGGRKVGPIQVAAQILRRRLGRHARAMTDALQVLEGSSAAAILAVAA